MQGTKSNLALVLLALTAGSLSACAGASMTPGQTASTAGHEVLASAEAAKMPMPDKIMINFPQGASWLTPEANRQLDFAARMFRDANPVVMFSKGYTDSVGSEFDNVMLSARRAEAVKRGLIARGVPAERLLIQALGKSEPEIANDPMAAENRRVVVTWRLS